MSRNTLKMPRNDGKFARVVARVKSAGPGPGPKSAAFPKNSRRGRAGKRGQARYPCNYPCKSTPIPVFFLNGEAFIFAMPCRGMRWGHGARLRVRGGVALPHHYPDCRCNGHAEKQMASPQAAWLRGKWSIGHFPAVFCPTPTPARPWRPLRLVLPPPVSYSAMKSPIDHFPCIHKVSKLVI